MWVGKEGGSAIESRDFQDPAATERRGDQTRRRLLIPWAAAAMYEEGRAMEVGSLLLSTGEREGRAAWYVHKRFIGRDLVYVT